MTGSRPPSAQKGREVQETRAEALRAALLPTVEFLSRRRADLIDLDVHQAEMTEEEKDELAALQAFTRALVNLAHPGPSLPDRHELAALLKEKPCQNPN